MKLIYLARAHYNYEGFDVIRAFESETDAIALIESCKAHMAKEPDYPGPGASPALMDAWHAALKKWHSEDPEGFERGDNYDVDEIPLYPPHPEDCCQRHPNDN